MHIRTLATLHSDADTTVHALSAQLAWACAPPVLKADNGQAPS